MNTQLEVVKPYYVTYVNVYAYVRVIVDCDNRYTRGYTQCSRETATLFFGHNFCDY